MSKVTSKFQVSVPKALADQYGIAPGDNLIWEPAGEALRVRLAEPRARYALDSVRGDEVPGESAHQLGLAIQHHIEDEIEMDHLGKLLHLTILDFSP